MHLDCAVEADLVGAKAELETAMARDALVDVAMTIIETRGSQALTVAELAARAGVSTAHVARHFETQDDMVEALAERWFRPKVAIMEDVLATDLPPRRKMFEFYARRFEQSRESYLADPVVFRLYCELGAQHFELVRSYVDLGDHYLGTIISEAMADGHFAGLDIDETISLVNQMVTCYVNPTMMMMVVDRLSTQKLARIVDALFDGLSATDRGAMGVSGLRAA